MLELNECKSFSEMLEKKAPDFPQVIVAGWMLPTGRPVGISANRADSAEEATVGKTAAAYAACLSAVLIRIGQLAESNPGVEDHIIQIVKYVVDGMSVAGRLRNDLVTKETLSAMCASVDG